MSSLPPRHHCPYALDGSAADIHGEAAALRTMGPATQVELPGGVAAWSVTDPDLVRRLLVHPHVSMDAHQHWPAYLNGDLPADWPLQIWVDIRTVQTAYGPDHRRLRRPLVPAFTARRVRALASRIAETAAAVLDDVAEVAATAPDGVVDLRTHFASRLPWLMVTALLGLPEAMHDDFQRINDTVFATDLTAEQAAANTAEATRLLGSLIAVKTERPGDDVTSALVDAHRTGLLGEQELADSLWMMMGAGYGTTAGLLDHAVVNLLTHPAQLDLAMSGRVGWDQVVEETLRHQAPVANFFLRFLTEDLYDEATGLTFARGDALVINYAAVGRDPGVHGPDAHVFDITRPTAREHLAFGYGSHYCLGAELARLEGRIALPALFSRYPGLAFAVAPDRLTPLPSLIFNGHRELPVRLDRTSNRWT
ncbi:cytochrome P450 [Streptomyces sp. HNM0645]|uniref:cytochrome P450 family protein n=1 Tax=Streptomyces sp. HNM0645 TaxID=2782343 RepID=UPI0024B84040|nr:cytochrome P450 [Streptomyces sp. HNM0645]MDI9886415.1 cytochrome P450 [Streptomyces sp. HNM0645]